MPQRQARANLGGPSSSCSPAAVLIRTSVGSPAHGRRSGRGAAAQPALCLCPAALGARFPCQTEFLPQEIAYGDGPHKPGTIGDTGDSYLSISSRRAACANGVGVKASNGRGRSRSPSGRTGSCQAAAGPDLQSLAAGALATVLGADHKGSCPLLHHHDGAGPARRGRCTTTSAMPRMQPTAWPFEPWMR